MTNPTSDRLEIFLALALSRSVRQSFTAENFIATADFENELPVENTSGELTEEKFPALGSYLTDREAEELRRIQENYQNKPDAEKTIWRASILGKIGTDEQLIDETVHWSHVGDALQKEIPAVQKIIKEKIFAARELKTNPGAAKSEKAFEEPPSPLEKTVRRTFAKQFISLRDLQKPTAFDRLGGTHLARLIRLSGIREVALACVRIEAVESVGAFLRRFPAEDARAIAAQLNGLRKTSESRLSFAENLVQTTIEIESQPSAMLDLLGIWLIGILLCTGAKNRVRYTNQKLPLEASAKLPEIIEERCRSVPEDLQLKISAEIEHLAETIARAASDRKPAATKKKPSAS